MQIKPKRTKEEGSKYDDLSVVKVGGTRHTDIQGTPGTPSYMADGSVT